MQNKLNTSVERIIAKIDNDFNPDNSDWIPRVGAWCVDAMSMLDCLKTTRVKKKFSVKDRIVYAECDYFDDNINVYDENGCKISKAGDRSCCDTSFTGEVTQISHGEVTPDTVDYVEQQTDASSYVKADTINGLPNRYNVVGYKVGNNANTNKNYVIVDCNKLELNFDTDYIYVDFDSVVTYNSDKFGCELPVIPNNGLLIEAITYYCMYKMLCRGYKHPVFNLAANQYGTNPYYQWTTLKDEAKRSIINGNIDVGDASKLFRSNLYISDYDPRNM